MLTAVGLGAYITQATTAGDWPHIILRVAMMSLFAVTLNRLFWRRLYALACWRWRASRRAPDGRCPTQRPEPVLAQ